MPRLVLASASAIILTGLIVSLCGVASATSPIADPRPIVTAASDGLILDWSAPLPHIQPRSDSRIEVAIPGYSRIEQPGGPQLPFTSVLIALPPDSDPTVRILHIEETLLSLPGPLAIAPHPAGVLRDKSGSIISGAFAPSLDTRDAPTEPIQIEIIGVMRGVRLARVTFYPARPNAECALRVQNARFACSLRVTTHVRVHILFNSKRSAVGGRRSVVSDPILNAVRAAVINPNQISDFGFRISEPIRAPQSEINDLQSAIEVTSPGLTAITYATLQAVGFPLDTDPRYLHLTRAGIEIAVEWDGDADASFEPNERLLFYAEPRFSRYSKTDVYFISSDTTPGLRMSTRSASPTGAQPAPAWIETTAETNALYLNDPNRAKGSLPPGRDGDHWVWDELSCFKSGALPCAGHAAASYPIQLSDVNTAQPAAMTVWLIGYTDIVTASLDHRVDVSINGASIGRVEWNGKQAITATFNLAPGVLRASANTVTLALPGITGISIDGMWLDAFAIDYARGSQAVGASVRFATEPAMPSALLARPYRIYLPFVMKAFNSTGAGRAYAITLNSPGPYRAYDVTNPDRPVRLDDVSAAGSTITIGDTATSGARRFAITSESGIRSPVRVRPTSPLHTISGADYILIAPTEFTPALTNLIALRQSQGLTVTVEHPQAIYDTFGDGRPAPEAIRAYLELAYTTWTPRPAYVLLVGDGTYDPKQYYAQSPRTIIPPYLAEVDPWLGEAASDNRFVTLDGGDNLPDMLIGRLPVNTLTETHIVVNKIVNYEDSPAPGAWNNRTIFVADDPDGAGDFAAQSDVIISTFITSPFSAQRIYFAGHITATHQAIRDQWNSGAGLIMYTGHSSLRQWAAERLFHVDDVAALTNGPRLPVAAQMTCFTAAFHSPVYDTLDESLLRATNGGVVAAWGATGLGVSTGHSSLADGFVDSLYNNQTNLGMAAISGKLRVVAHQPAYLDLVDTFTLLGDPATIPNREPVLWSYFIYLPVIRR